MIRGTFQLKIVLPQINFLFTNFLENKRIIFVLELQNMSKKIKRNENKKTFKNFSIEEMNMEKTYIDLQKKQQEIMNYENVFNLIDKMSDNKTLITLKRELNRGNKGHNKNNYDDPFKKQYMNLDNYKYLIPHPDDKNNSDNQLLFAFFTHMSNKDRKKVNRRSSVFSYMSSTKSPKRQKCTTQTSNMFTTKNFFGSTSETYFDTEENNNNNTSTSLGRRKSFYKYKLNKKQLEILNKAQKEKEELDKINYRMCRTMRNFKTEIKRNSNNNSIEKKNRNIRVKKKFEDKSKYFFPLINKVIYGQNKKEDFFEKAKENFVLKYKETKQKLNNIGNIV